MSPWRCSRILCAIVPLALPLGLASGSATAADPGHARAGAQDAARIPCTACSIRTQLSLLSAPQLSAAAAYGVALAYRAPRRTENLQPKPLPELKRKTVIRDLAFRDNQPLVNRLKRLQALPFVTVWDSTAATLYVGMNRDGEPGLHLRQKKHDRGTLVPAGRTLFVDAASGRTIAWTGPAAVR